jgi:hypothetical protein
MEEEYLTRIPQALGEKAGMVEMAARELEGGEEAWLCLATMAGSLFMVDTDSGKVSTAEMPFF